MSAAAGLGCRIMTNITPPLLSLIRPSWWFLGWVVLALP